ncbi:hypothetical protein KI387_028902, partial [Taxus chinensis]
LVNLPLHLWYALEDIGYVLGRFLKIDQTRVASGIHTFSITCTKIDLSKVLPKKIHLKMGNMFHVQYLDYENIAFRCHIYRNIGHLQVDYLLGKTVQGGNHQTESKERLEQHEKRKETFRVKRDH